MAMSWQDACTTLNARPFSCFALRTPIRLFRTMHALGGANARLFFEVAALLTPQRPLSFFER
jgi:hypothetical protein